MPQKHKNNKIRIKINDKKITNYMFDFTRTIIFVFAIISVAFTFIIRDANVVGNSMLDTLHSDDKIFITNFMYEPKCGDIVANNAEKQIEKKYIKRHKQYQILNILRIQLSVIMQSPDSDHVFQRISPDAPTE